MAHLIDSLAKHAAVIAAGCLATSAWMAFAPKAPTGWLAVFWTLLLGSVAAAAIRDAGKAARDKRRAEAFKRVCQPTIDRRQARREGR